MIAAVAEAGGIEARGGRTLGGDDLAFGEDRVALEFEARTESREQGLVVEGRERELRRRPVGAPAGSASGPRGDQDALPHPRSVQDLDQARAAETALALVGDRPTAAEAKRRAGVKINKNVIDQLRRELTGTAPTGE